MFKDCDVDKLKQRMTSINDELGFNKNKLNLDHENEEEINFKSHKDIKNNSDLVSKRKLNENIKNLIQNYEKEGKNSDLINKKKPITYNTLKKALIQGFQKELNIEFVESRLTEKEIERAKKLEKEKYGNERWNLRI
jgi:lipoate-protein ligase A